MLYFEKTHFSLFIGLIISVVGLAASYFLVPRWGVFGAAIGYMVVQFAHLFLFRAAIKYQLAKLKIS
jgi:O-antigen/teichoic acid export membrane protein